LDDISISPLRSDLLQLVAGYLEGASST
jgi:hypothetical protein